MQGSSDQSSNRHRRFTTQMNNRYAINNGTMPTLDSNAAQSNFQVNDKVMTT